MYGKYLYSLQFFHVSKFHWIYFQWTACMCLVCLKPLNTYCLCQVLHHINDKRPRGDPILHPAQPTIVSLQLWSFQPHLEWENKETFGSTSNFNANGSVRWRTSLYLNLFHWPMGKNSGNGNGVCRYVRALSSGSWSDTVVTVIGTQKSSYNH